MGSPFTEQELATARAIIERHAGSPVTREANMKSAAVASIVDDAAERLAQINTEIDAMIVGDHFSAPLRKEFVKEFANLSQSDAFDAIERLGQMPRFAAKEFRRRVDEARRDSKALDAATLGGDGKATKTNGPFRITDISVVYTDPDPDKEDVEICGPLEVVALTRDAAGDNWGRVLRWEDPLGGKHEWAMPMSLLAGDGCEYRSLLLSGGLTLAPGNRQRSLLTTYIQTQKPEARALCVSRPGWHGHNFVLPNATIGPQGAERVLFQTASGSDHRFNVRGGVDDWRDHIGKRCVGNSRLVLAVSCGFAGSTLSLVGSESGGIHLKGTTSTGKTTALQVGASVCGGGPQGFVRSWRATANGLEAIAEGHNDATLFLDELAQVDAKEAADAAYMLGNGGGKGRMGRSGDTRKSLTWTLLLLSTGETTLADHAATAGRRVKGGAEVRLLNIEADAGKGMGCFENIHDAESPDAFARQLKEAAGRYYGTPLRAFLEWLTEHRSEAEAALRKCQAAFVNDRVPAGASGEVSPAAQRFGLIAAAGDLASSIGITGWEQGEATDAAALCLNSWIACRGTVGSGDAEAAVNQVRLFIAAHGASRFQSTKKASGIGMDLERIINRAGFRVDTDGETSEYLILSDVFRREVCDGFDATAVAQTLRDRGFLDCPDPTHLTIKPRVPELGTPRVYAVKSSILGA